MHMFPMRRIWSFVCLFTLLGSLIQLPVFATSVSDTQDTTLMSLATDLSFQATWLPTAVMKTTSVVSGDINGDGWLDAFFSYDNGTGSRGGVRAFFNHGGRLSVTPDWEAELPYRVRDSALGDLNHDGLLDLVVATYNGPLLVFHNDGGQLPSTPTWESHLDHKGWSLALGDLDGDSWLDVVVVMYGQPAVMYRNTGTGEFGILPIWEADNPMDATYVALGDLDGDQDLDMAIAGYGVTTTTQVYENTGGTFGSLPLWETTQQGWMTSVVWVNSDADPGYELFVATESPDWSAETNKLYDAISGTLSLEPIWSAATPSETQDMVVGDLDGDQDQDLVIVNGNVNKSRGHLEVFLATEAGYSTTPDWVSIERDISYGLTLADMDNDGDLDVLRANTDTPSRLYLNHQRPFAADLAWNPSDPSSTRSLAWGDYDNDGLTDLALGTAQGVRVYQQTGTGLADTPVWMSSTTLHVYTVLWADMDMDTDLDLMVATTAGVFMYANHGDGSLSTQPVWNEDRYGSHYMSMVLADADGDGDLDIALGMLQQPIQILRNLSADQQAEGVPDVDDISTRDGWTGVTNPLLNIRGLAWADMDGDGDQDLAVASDGYPTQVYRNDGVVRRPGNEPIFAFERAWQNNTYFDSSRSVQWADIDGNGWQDLVIANYSQPNRVFLNHNGVLAREPEWSSQDNDPTNGVAVCDIEGDGDVDVLAINEDAPTRLYLNVGGHLNTAPDWSSPDVGAGFAGACGDVDHDGDYDLSVGYLDHIIEGTGQEPGHPSGIYRNLRVDRMHQNQVPQIVLERPGGPNADHGSSAHILDTPTLSVTYTLTDTDAWQVALEYSRVGGGLWEAAVPTTTTQTATLPIGTHAYEWDLFQSGIMGTLNAVTLRLTAIPDVRPAPHGAAGSYRYGAYAVTSYPFRVRGTTIHVLRDDRPTQPAAAGAKVYRIPSGHDGGGRPMAPSATSAPFVTDDQGYIQGAGVLKPGDQLLALAPISETHAYRLYYTNGIPTNQGVAAWTMQNPGTQRITVSPEHPLFLFNLTISLAWDASRDARYMQRLEADLYHTSRHLYDFTNGQMALGTIQIYHNGEQREEADVVIHATNRLRPFTVIGGVVITPTHDPLLPDITYDPGQVHMGAVWNRYGDVGASHEQDWSLVLAHELSHYLFYLDDTYLGIEGDDILIPVDTCPSAMGDVYNPRHTEFLADPGVWQELCGTTLAAHELGRTEWDTLQMWYPDVHVPSVALDGPTIMPFVFTTMSVITPTHAPVPLEDPQIVLAYETGTINSGEAQVYRLTAHDQIVPLGSPPGGQGYLLARGMVAGDRICVFDRPRQHYGCEVMQESGQTIDLASMPLWTPQIALSPVTTRTYNLTVTGVPSGLDLHARLFPDVDVPSAAITLTATTDGYHGTITTPHPALSGHIHLWGEDATLVGTERPEMIIAYSVGGNPGYYRIGGGPIHGGSPGYYRIGGANALSPDGQMLFFTKQDFPVGHFYALQQMADLPDPPAGKRLVGLSYRLVTAPDTVLESGSVAFQYRGDDVLLTGVDETSLQVAFWNGAFWQILPTTLSTASNMASALMHGPGAMPCLETHQRPMSTV